MKKRTPSQFSASERYFMVRSPMDGDHKLWISEMHAEEMGFVLEDSNDSERGMLLPEEIQEPDIIIVEKF